MRPSCPRALPRAREKMTIKNGHAPESNCTDSGPDYGLSRAAASITSAFSGRSRELLPALMIELTEQHAGDGLAAARARICGSRTSLPQQANAHSRPARAAVPAVSRDLSSWAASTRFISCRGRTIGVHRGGFVWPKVEVASFAKIDDDRP